MLRCVRYDQTELFPRDDPRELVATQVHTITSVMLDRHASRKASNECQAPHERDMAARVVLVNIV
jgi:hypothetical protein